MKTARDTSDYINLPKRHTVEAIKYTTWMLAEEYNSWLAVINGGKSLPPEIIGVLLARAEPQMIIKEK